MRFSVDVGVLRAAVGEAVPVTEKKTTMPILSALLLVSDGKGSLDVVATDLDVSLSRRVAVNEATAGRGVVAARALHEILRSLPSGNVTIEAVKGQRLLVAAGGAEFRLAMLDAADYPAVKFAEEELDTSLPGKAFGALLGRVAYASSRDESRHNLCGVFIEKAGSGLRAVATDGHRLALADVDAKVGSWPTKGLILGSKAVTLVRALAGEDAADVAVGVSGSAMTVKAGSATLSARLVEGFFPDYRQVVPEGGSRIVTVGRDRLLSALQRVALVLSRDKSAVKVEVGEGEVTLRAGGDDVGEAKESLPVTAEGGGLSIGFNPRYLSDALGSFGSDDVRVEFKDDLSPAVLLPVGAASGKCVVMPMKV